MISLFLLKQLKGDMSEIIEEDTVNASESTSKKDKKSNRTYKDDKKDKKRMQKKLNNLFIINSYIYIFNLFNFNIKSRYF